MNRALAFLICLGGVLPLGSSALVREADDLQRMIDSARQNTRDLERLDELGAVREEITLMRSWLDQSWRRSGACSNCTPSRPWAISARILPWSLPFGVASTLR